jgi:hypothetical protein
MTYRLAKTRHHYMQKPDNQQGGTPHRLLIYIAYFTILAGDPELNGGRLFTVRTPPGITGRNHVPHSSFAGCLDGDINITHECVLALRRPRCGAIAQNEHRRASRNRETI